MYVKCTYIQDVYSKDVSRMYESFVITDMAYTGKIPILGKDRESAAPKMAQLPLPSAKKQSVHQRIPGPVSTTKNRFFILKCHPVGEYEHSPQGTTSC
jgi:hypothetical protein